MNTKKIHSNILSLIDVSRYLVTTILAPDVKISIKKVVTGEISRHQEKLEEIIANLLKYMPSFELGLEFLKNTCMLGFDIRLNKLGERIIDMLKTNPDLLAGLADIFIETGHIDLAYTALRILLNNKYNILTVLLNLAIVSYLLGYPRIAMRYVRVYEKLAGTKSKMRVPLLIASGDLIID